MYKLFISPHLDDIIFSLGSLIETISQNTNIIIATVFTKENKEKLEKMTGELYTYGNYKKRLIEDWAKKGIVNDGSGNYSLKKFVKDKFLDSELEPKTFKINTSGLDVTAKYKVWIFAIENEYGDEILRDDIYGKDYFTGKKNTYTISSSSILKKLPYNYILFDHI